MSFLNKMSLMALGTAALISSAFAAQTVDIPNGASHEETLKLANTCTPHKRQLKWQQLEYTCFIHFGPNTFTGKEWGNGKEDPNVFGPKNLDTDQWCRVAKEAGMKMVMITTKHHDGFCTWQTRYNDTFSVRATKWKKGKGDVLKEMVKSARKYGLKVGVYVSPADLYQIENKEGLYGNLSKYKNSVIPTDPKYFSKQPMKGRKPPKGKPTFKYKVDDYNRYFLNQLYELLTEYGTIHEVWFDGAHPKRKGGQVYTRDYWYELIHKLAPKAVIQGKGPDARWCGNEHGGTREQEWTPLPLGTKLKDWHWPDRTGENIARDDKLKGAKAIHWYPSEVDVSIRHGWFFRDERQGVHGADKVFDIYERSIGSNAVLLLNVPPTKDGVFGERDVKVLLEVGRRIRTTYGNNLLDAAKGEKKILDGNIKTYKIVDKKGVVIKLDGMKKINRFVVQEAISSHGQRVKSFSLEAKIDGQWKEVKTAGTIGYKKTLFFDEITTNKLRLKILDSRAGEEVAIATVAAHYYNKTAYEVTMKQNKAGRIELSSGENLEIRYTLNGKTPTQSSKLYKKALSLPKGGTLKAASVSNGKLGSPQTFHIGMSRTAWSVKASSKRKSSQTAKKAIDGDSKTYWSSKKVKYSHKMTIDLGGSQKVTGFAYLPRQNKSTAEGMIEKFHIEASSDGETWGIVEKGTFGNLVNDPTRRIHWFKKSHELRYFRLVFLKGARNKKSAAIAEIDIFVK